MTGNEATLLYLSSADVRRALPMADAIEAMNAAFLQLSEGRVTMPARSSMQIPEANGVVLLMPCYAAGTHQVSLKLLTQFSDNSRLGLPLIQAVVLLADAVNGRLLALMDGCAITALRTGAASGVATRLLAQPRVDTAAIFGASDEVTLFKSVGVAVQDLFAAARALENARRLRIGTALT